MAFRHVLKGDPSREIVIEVEGAKHRVPAGISVAAALLLTGNDIRRSPVDASPRAPFCLMGICFECLVTIDGVEGQQGCLVTIREGMAIARGVTPYETES